MQSGGYCGEIEGVAVLRPRIEQPGATSVAAEEPQRLHGGGGHSDEEEDEDDEYYSGEDSESDEDAGPSATGQDLDAAALYEW